MNDVVPMTINAVSSEHYAWVCRMGWNNKNTLEQLALVASEVGEAVNECRGEAPTDLLQFELADIVLRVMGVAESLGIDLETAIAAKMKTNEMRGTRGRKV